MAHQLDLWDKPFHSITVYEKSNPNTGGRSLVTRFDHADQMIESVRRELIQHAEKPNLPRIAYIYLCARHGEGNHYKVSTVATAYPGEDDFHIPALYK